MLRVQVTLLETSEYASSRTRRERFTVLGPDYRRQIHKIGLTIHLEHWFDSSKGEYISITQSEPQ